MQVDLISILLILGLGQCFFLMVVVIFSEKRKKLPGQLLWIILFALFWYQLEFFILRNSFDVQISFLYSTRYGSWLILGPLIFLYNRASLIRRYRVELKDIYHFLPFLIFTLIIPLSLGEILTNRSKDYGMLTVFDQYNQEMITWKHYLYAYIFIIQFIHALVYVFIASIETYAIENNAKKVSANISRTKIDTLRFMYASAIVIIILCFGFVLHIYTSQMWRREYDYFYVIPVLVFVFGLSYRAIRYPESFIISIDESQPKYAKSSLPKAKKEFLVNRLKKVLEEDLLYQEADLRLKDLADKMNLSTHHLSQLINQELDQTFFDLINTYRIREAKEQISTQMEKPLIEIAYSVGYNNKNSFSRAFKKYEGITPSQYKNKVLSG